VQLIPLRERPEDIPALVESFNAHFSARHGRRHKHFSDDFLRALMRHPWPGNIRQLRNLIERLVVTVRDSQIGPALAPPPPAFATTQADTSILFTVKSGDSIPEVENRLIRETLARVTRSRAEAARILGISPRTLAYRLRALKLPESSSSAPA